MNSSKPPSSDGPGYCCAEALRATSRRSVARAVAANAAASRASPDQARSWGPIERVDEVVEHHTDACRRCGALMEGEDPYLLRHRVIEHWLHRLVCPAAPPAPVPRCRLMWK